MLSARQLGIARPRFIKSGLRNNVSTNHCLLSVAAGQPSDSIVGVATAVCACLPGIACRYLLFLLKCAP